MCVFNPFLLAPISKRQLGIYACVGGGEENKSPIGFMTCPHGFSLFGEVAFEATSRAISIALWRRPGDSTHPFVSIFGYLLLNARTTCKLVASAWSCLPLFPPKLGGATTWKMTARAGGIVSVGYSAPRLVLQTPRLRPPSLRSLSARPPSARLPLASAFLLPSYHSKIDVPPALSQPSSPCLRLGRERVCR